MSRVRLAAAAARARSRRIGGGEDRESGFMLVYVLMITSIITVLVGSTLVSSSGSVIPAQQAAYNQAATAAAQGGLQAFLAYADAQCTNLNASVATCTLPATDSGTVPIVTSGSYTASYRWTASKGTNYIRVSSLGSVTNGGVSAKIKLIADVAGGVSSNLLDAGYATQFETQAPDVALSLFPANRNIPMSSTYLGKAGLPNTGTAVTWNGAQSGSGAGTVNVCNSLFGGSSGRVNNPPPNAPDPYVDWSETGTIGTAAYTAYEPCQVTLGHDTQFLAPTDTTNGLGEILSNDAFLLSNSYPGGTGPTLDQPVYTGYQYDASTDGACGATGQNYRTYNLLCAGYPINIGGTPAAGSYIPAWEKNLPQWPTAAPVIKSGGATGACWYNGPTRVLLKSDGSALVTSPQTTSVVGSSDLSCYGGTTPSSGGLLGVTVANIATASHGVIYVQNNGTAPSPAPARSTNTGWGLVNTRSSISPTNSVFYSTVPASGPTSTPTYATTAADKPYTPVFGDNPSTQTDAAWTPQWTSDTSGTTCSSGSPALTDLHFYRCYAASGAYDATAYVDLKSAVKTALSTSPSSYATTSGFNGLVTSKVSTANSGDAANSAPTFTDYRSHRWQASTVADATATDGCTPVASHNTGSSGPTPVHTALSTDPLFQNTDGSQTTTTTSQTQCFTTTVTMQIGTCNVALVLGACLNLGNYVWGNGTALLGGGKSIAQFKVTETVVTTTNTVSATAATTSFPLDTDVTSYAAGMSTAGPGDLYVQGTAASTLALVAQDDVVVTNNLKPSNTTSNAIMVVAQNNVRMYHPVSCVSTATPSDIAATTAGFCPNDLTGLYSGVLDSQYRPDQQYTNLAADQTTGNPLTNLQVNAAIFALGNASVSCPKPASGSGYCGGEITTDNYNRGNGLGSVTITGDMAMAHHGPLGQEWEVADSSGLTSRPYSGYQLTERYQNLKSAIQSVSPVSSVLNTTTVSSSTWRIVSLSTGSP